MIDQQGMTQGFNTNPLVGLTQEETLSNCQEFLEHMQQACEDLGYGHHVNMSLLRGAIGHELAKVSRQERVTAQVSVLDRQTG